jgi:hypothetical protein
MPDSSSLFAAGPVGGQCGPVPTSGWVLVLLLLASVAGCGPSRPATTRVSGLVTFKGAPVAEADVNFIPADGRPASGRTDAEGRFSLSTFVPGDGVLPGEHVVTVSKQVASKSNPDDIYQNYVDLLPPQYGSLRTSPLRATVEAGGSHDLTFDLDPAPTAATKSAR